MFFICNNAELNLKNCTPDYIKFLILSSKTSYLNSKFLLYSLAAQPSAELINRLTTKANELILNTPEAEKIDFKEILKIFSQVEKIFERRDSLLVKPTSQELSILDGLISKIRKKGTVDDSLPKDNINQLLLAENGRLDFYLHNSAVKLCRAFQKGYVMSEYAYIKSLKIQKLITTKKPLVKEANKLNIAILVFKQELKKSGVPSERDFNKKMAEMHKKLNLLELKLLNINYEIKAVWDDFISNELKK